MSQLVTSESVWEDPDWKRRTSHIQASRVPVSGGREMHCRIDSQKKVSTNSTRSQERNNKNKEFTKKNYGWVSEDLRNMKSCMGLAPKCHLKPGGILVSSKTIYKKRSGRAKELLGECEYFVMTAMLSGPQHKPVTSSSSMLFNKIYWG